MTDWSTKKLGEVCDVIIGGTPRRGVGEYWSDGDLPWVSIADLSRNGREISNTKEKITEVGAKRSNVKLLKEGTILFSFKLSIGKLAFAGIDLYTNEAIAGLRIKNDRELDKEFLFYFLQQLNFDDAQKAVKGKTLNKEKIKKLEIPLPPIAEQKKIVARIEKQFAKIDEAARLRAESEAATAALLPAALHEIFSQAESKGWKMVVVGDICEIKGGKRLPKGHKLTDGKTEHPYIRVADFVLYGINQNAIKYISDETFKTISRYIISKSDVFISIAGTIGATGIIPENLDGANLTENAAKLTNLRGIEQRYLMYMLSGDLVQQQIKREAIQTTISKLGLFRIAKLEIPLPPLAEQKEIVKKLDALSEKVRALQALQSEQAADLKALKQSILHEAFVG